MQQRRVDKLCDWLQPRKKKTPWPHHAMHVVHTGWIFGPTESKNEGGFGGHLTIRRGLFFTSRLVCSVLTSVFPFFTDNLSPFETKSTPPWFALRQHQNTPLFIPFPIATVRLQKYREQIGHAALWARFFLTTFKTFHCFRAFFFLRHKHYFSIL